MEASAANRILVVEDDPTVRGYLVTVLTDDGFSITARPSGKAAKELLKKESFDLVLTDLIMPEFSGIDLLHFIRKNRINSKVILLTAFGDIDSVLEALRAGADDFLVKPCDRLVLHKAITRAFERINLEREKQKADERYHRLFDSTTDMVFMLDSQGVVTEMNTRGLEIFGRTKGQIVGKPFKRIIHKDELETANDSFYKTLAGNTVQFVARIRPKDDSLLFFEFDYSPLHIDGAVAGVYCIAHDITSLKQLQTQLEEYSRNLEKIVEERSRELKTSSERLRAIASSAQDAIITIAESGEIAFANPAAGLIFRKEPEKIVGESIETFIPTKIQESGTNPILPFLRKAKGYSEGTTVEICARREDGEEFPAEISISSFEIGTNVFATVFLRDTTSRAEFQNRILKNQKMESIGRLAGGIAHNLNNILCGVLGYASFLKSNIENKNELPRYLETMEESCIKAANLVRQVLEYAEGGKYHVETSNPRELIKNTVEFLRRSMPPTISIEFKTEKSELNIDCDPGQIRQVLLNLCINAQEAMRSGGTLTLAVEDVIIDNRNGAKHPDLKPGKYTAISVKDTGEGIERKDMERMFEPFYSTKGFGYGLGLASSLGIVKKHKGIIEAQSERDKGTTFTVFLPGTNKKSVEVQSGKQSVIRPGTETILVIDDEEVFLELAKDVLTKSGYKVIPAGNGGDGLKIFNKMKKQIDLVLLDMVLPDMKGEDVLRAMLDEKPGTRFAITSGYNLDGKPDEIRNCIKGAFLPKPCTAEKMTEVVRMALDVKS